MRTLARSKQLLRPSWRPVLQSSLHRGLGTFLVAAAAWIAWEALRGNEPTLNDTTFTPYRITRREAISPTSFVITVSPCQPCPPGRIPYLHPDNPGRWRFPLWSVEFKQPQVQIARHYTPLPPRPEDDPRDGSLRFYVRTVGDGEMSNYLSRLGEGEQVSLRGPHRGFDVLGRMGAQRDLVVLAGGTGVVPGLQAAEAVLSAHADAAVSVLWSVRRREELQSAEPPARSALRRWFSTPAPGAVGHDIADASPVGRQLRDMKSRYGDRFALRLSVDEEGSAFSARDVAETLARGGTTARIAHDCRLHSQALHSAASEFEPEPPSCSLEAGDAPAAGTNLLLVSGPEGFVSHFAGAKRWYGGTQVQGSLGGLVGHVFAQNPGFRNDWLVLKL